MWKNFLKLTASVVICEGAGALGTLFTVSQIPTWYASLIKPVLSPPNWIFGPVWTTLYALMGVAVYLIWTKGLENREVRFAFILFWIHLFFNAVWSIIFFGFQNIALALADILVLWLMIVILIIQFRKIRPVAAWLLVPYLLWVTFATYLNLSLLILN